MGRVSKCIITEEGRECSRCGKYQLYDNYGKTSTKVNRNGYDSICKGCRRVYANNYVAQGKQKEQYHKNPKAFMSRFNKYIGKMPGGVYQVYTNEGRYIGESQHMQHRVMNHKTPKSRTAVGGKEYLRWEVLEYIEDPDLRLEREAYWIDTLKPELNRQ